MQFGQDNTGLGITSEKLGVTPEMDAPQTITSIVNYLNTLNTSFSLGLKSSEIIVDDENMSLDSRRDHNFFETDLTIKNIIEGNSVSIEWNLDTFLKSLSGVNQSSVIFTAYNDASFLFTSNKKSLTRTVTASQFPLTLEVSVNLNTDFGPIVYRGQQQLTLGSDSIITLSPSFVKEQRVQTQEQLNKHLLAEISSLKAKLI